MSWREPKKERLPLTNFNVLVLADDDFVNCANVTGEYDVVSIEDETITSVCEVTQGDECNALVNCLSFKDPPEVSEFRAFVTKDMVALPSAVGYVVESVEPFNTTNIYFVEMGAYLREYIPCAIESELSDCPVQGYYCNDEVYPGEGTGRCDTCWAVDCDNATEQEATRCCELPGGATRTFGG